MLKQTLAGEGVELTGFSPSGKLAAKYYTSAIWVKIGAKVVKHARYVTFQLAEVLVSRSLFYEILERIHRLKAVPIETG